MTPADNPCAAPRAEVEPQTAEPGGLWSKVIEEPQGIGGWLILPLLSLIFTPILVGVGTVTQVVPALKPDVWEPLTTPGFDAYHPLWAPLIVFELAANLLIVGFSVVLLGLFLKKFHRVPKLMVIWLLTNAAVRAADLALAAQIPALASQGEPQQFGELARSVAVALIWISYFVRSRRVRNTFVRRIDPGSAPAVGDHRQEA